MNRRWRNLIIPRRRRFDPPWSTVAASPPAFSPTMIDQAGSRPRWTPLPRRGSFQAIVPAPAVVPPTSFVPSFTGPALRQRATRIRRGVFAAVNPPYPMPFALLEPSVARPRWASVRRGRFLVIPLAQATAPSLIEPGGVRSRPFGRRRGQFFPVPPLAITVGTGPVIPPITEPAGPRARTYAPRRGSFFRVPLIGLAPAVSTAAPGFLVGNRPDPFSVRRGRPGWVPPAALGVPDPISSSRPSLRPTRRGRLLWTPPAVPTAVTPWVPDQFSPNRTARPTLVKRGRFWVLTPTPVAPISTLGVGRIKSRRPTMLPIRRGNILDNWTAIVSMPGFVCQDFATNITATAYSATVSIDAYGATMTITADSVTLTIDAYAGTATNCGR